MLKLMHKGKIQLKADFSIEAKYTMLKDLVKQYENDLNVRKDKGRRYKH